MNAFFTDEFHISSIRLCLRVMPEHCQLIHRDRPTHGLVIILRGVTRYEFSDGSKMTVVPGQLFYLPKFSSYRVVRLEEGECIAVNFDLEDPRITYPHFSLPEGYGVKYTALLRELLAAWDKKTPGAINICYARLYEILCQIQRDAAVEYRDSHTRAMATAGAEYLAASLHRPELTVAETAAHLGISPEYFRRIFAAELGMSPKKYLLTLRLKKATELLSSGELTVSHICHMCGYEDESYFCREFKRLTGSSPGKYARDVTGPGETRAQGG